MAAVDFLPIAQPAARPDQAGARKPATAPNESGETSFAEVLDTEVDAAGETDVAAESAPADAAAAPAQSAPTPAANTAASVITAILQAPTVLPTDGEGSAPETTTQQPSSPAAPITPAISPDMVAEAAFASARDAVAAAPAAGAPVHIETVRAAPEPEGVAASKAPIAAPVATLTATKTETTPYTAVQVTTDEILSEAAPNDASTADQSSGQPAKPAHPTSPAPTVVAATPASDVAVQVVAAVMGGQTPPPKPIALTTPSDNAPGQRRKTAGAEIAAPTADASAATTKPGAQPAQPGVSPAQPANGQAKVAAQAAAVAADAAAADVKPDAAPAPSSNSSTSFADALSAARGQSAEPGRTPATSAHLQSAPAAAAQVYTRFVERFDGRAQRFEVRLDPAELGRVDVRIEIGADKKVHAVLAAHDSAALTDLMRGQRSLERALSDAGIDLAEGGLRFELSQDSGRNLAGQQRGDGWSNDELAHAWRGFSTVDVAIDANSADIAAVTHSYSRGASRLNLVA